jgi:hypothetical protein
MRTIRNTHGLAELTAQSHSRWLPRCSKTQQNRGQTRIKRLLKRRGGVGKAGGGLFQVAGLTWPCRRRLPASARGSRCAATAQPVSPRNRERIWRVSSRSAAFPEPTQAKGTRAWRHSRWRREGADRADRQDLPGRVTAGGLDAQCPVGPHATQRQSA